MLLASRLAPQASAGPLSQRAGSRDGGADAGSVAGDATPDKLADCSAFEGVPPQSTKGWKEDAPYMAAAIHCGNRYILQVKSKSKEPWVTKPLGRRTGPFRRPWSSMSTATSASRRVRAHQLPELLAGRAELVERLRNRVQLQIPLSAS